MSTVSKTLFAILRLLLPFTSTSHGGFPAQSQLDFLQQVAVFQRRGDALFILELFVHLRLARVRAFGDFYLFLRARAGARDRDVHTYTRQPFNDVGTREKNETKPRERV